MNQSPLDRRSCLRSGTNTPLWINHMRDQKSVQERCLLARDVSEAGIFVETNRPWPVGSTVQIENIFGATSDNGALPEWIARGRLGTVVRNTPEGMGIHLDPVALPG